MTEVETVKEIADLTNKIDTIEKRQEERHQTQLVYNEQVAKTLTEISNAINRIDIFQAELNHTAKMVDENRTKTEENTKAIVALDKTLSADKNILDELKQWRLFFAAAIITLFVGALWNTFKPDTNQDAMLKLTEAVERLADNGNN